MRLDHERHVRDGDRYELVGELASGGMATVYLARMRRPMGFSRLVAVKCMHPQYAKDPANGIWIAPVAEVVLQMRSFYSMVRISISGSTPKILHLPNGYLLIM